MRFCSFAIVTKAPGEQKYIKSANLKAAIITKGHEYDTRNKWKLQCLGTLKLRTVYFLVSSFELLYHSPSENLCYLNFLNISLLAMQSGMRHTTKRDQISVLIDESY